MKFLAVLAESGAADTLSKITEFISKICKDRVILRISPNAIFLINSTSLANNGTHLRITLNVSEFFSTYVMAGVTPRFNEIYAEVNKDFLYQSMAVKDRSTKIRMVKIGNKPHLKVEQRSCGMTHELPVVILAPVHWREYDMPPLNNVQVALYLPSLTTVRNLVAAFKNMGIKNMDIQGSQEGELLFCGELELANIVVHFSNLSSAPVDTQEMNGSVDSVILRTVRVDIRPVYCFLRSLVNGFTMSPILLKIIPQKMVIFSVEQDEASVLYVVSGIS